MLLATAVRRAWLEQTNGTYLPVLIVRHVEGSDIYIKCECQPLTPMLECHLTYEEPPQKQIVDSTLAKAQRELDRRENMIWSSADYNQLVQLHSFGHVAPTDKTAVRLSKALIRHEAKTKREAAKAAQQAEVERRRIIREERAKLRAEREAEAAGRGVAKVSTPDKDQSEPAVLEPAPTPEPQPSPTPEPQLEPLPAIIDYKIEILVKHVQAHHSAVVAA